MEKSLLLRRLIKSVSPLNEKEIKELKKLETTFGRKFDLIAMVNNSVYGYVASEMFTKEDEKNEYKEKIDGVPEGFRGMYIGTEKQHERYRRLVYREAINKARSILSLP